MRMIVGEGGRMRQAVALALKGTWSMAATVAIATLDHASRDRTARRIVTDGGEEVRLKFTLTGPMQDGDALVLDSGSHVLVRAAIERCARIRSDEAEIWARIAWQLGRRRVPVQITADALIIPDDPALTELALGLGADIESGVEMAFNPEHIDVPL